MLLVQVRVITVLLAISLQQREIPHVQPALLVKLVSLGALYALPVLLVSSLALLGQVHAQAVLLVLILQ